uniref:Integrase, catalytic region, zinc finger, CCHC-type, peptidase aspartic, catalytic n=1 Tax=Tanacetum cinerariifolium TaxID=118510 RepID=A0A6L2P9Q2_TANCI|nr:hypothetical protein [Tanacetum cinerariifolium]
MFTDCTTKVDSEPPNGLNEDITNPYECDQTLNVSARTLNLSAGLVPQPPSLTPNLPPTKNDWDTVFCTLFDEYFNPPPCAVSPVPTAVAAPRAVDPVVHLRQLQLIKMYHNLCTSPTIQEIQSQVTHQGAEEQMHGHQNA